MINKAVVRVYKVMHILAVCQKLKILWHFEILTWESMANLECGIIQKRSIAERKGLKFETRGTTVHI